jgi:hypothetical protein
MVFYIKIIFSVSSDLLNFADLFNRIKIIEYSLKYLLKSLMACYPLIVFQDYKYILKRIFVLPAQVEKITNETHTSLHI